jgi:hypothetical protein
MRTPSLAVLTIDLADVEPTVHRRITVPFNIRLDRLHLVIQAAMGWTNSHLYEFRIGESGWGLPDPYGDFDGPMDASKAKLDATLVDAGRKSFTYIYDFGDGWEHKVKLVKVTPSIDALPRIQLVQAIGRCPPEDCGGAPGYERLLEILADPGDAEHEEMLEWAGGPIDPRKANEARIEAALEQLDKRWSRGGAGRKRLTL